MLPPTRPPIMAELVPSGACEDGDLAVDSRRRAVRRSDWMRTLRVARRAVRWASIMWWVWRFVLQRKKVLDFVYEYSKRGKSEETGGES